MKPSSVQIIVKNNRLYIPEFTICYFDNIKKKSRTYIGDTRQQAWLYETRRDRCLTGHT